jgi:hypothetical protein
MTDEGAVRIFPNPSSGEVNLTFNRTFEKVQLDVYNISGECVYNARISATDKYHFKLEGPCGNYVMNVRFDDGSEAAYKVVKE